MQTEIEAFLFPHMDLDGAAREITALIGGKLECYDFAIIDDFALVSFVIAIADDECGSGEREEKSEEGEEEFHGAKGG
jgi:hypothetical protein